MIALRRPQDSRRLVFSGWQHTIVKISCLMQCNIYIYISRINKSDVAPHQRASTNSRLVFVILTYISLHMHVGHAEVAKWGHSLHLDLLCYGQNLHMVCIKMTRRQQILHRF